MQFDNKTDNWGQNAFDSACRKAKNSIIVSAALAFGTLAIPSALFAQEKADKPPAEYKPAMRMGHKIIKERTFFGELMEKEHRKENMIKAVLNSRNVAAYTARRLMQKVNAPENDRQRFEAIMDSIVKMESDEKIRTSIYTAFAETEEDAEKEMERKESIEHAITITFYPTENAMIIQVLSDFKADDNRFEKGTYIIYDEEGMRIERPEKNRNENKDEKD